MRDEALSIVRADLVDRALADAWEHGRSLSTDEAVELALAESDV